MTIDLTTRNLLISLCSHMSYMQGQLEALHQLDDPDGHYWYRESVALRQKVADHLAALADEPAVPQGREPAAVTGQPSDGEVAELVETLKGIAYWRLHGKPGDKPAPFDIRQAARLTRVADPLQRLSPPQPVPVSERLPGPEDCDAAGRCWWHRYTPTPEWHLRFGRTGQHNHWLPAHALPLPEVGE